MRFLAVSALLAASILAVPAFAQQDESQLLPPGQKLDRKPPADIMKMMMTVGHAHGIGDVAISPDAKHVAWESRTDHGARVVVNDLGGGMGAGKTLSVASDKDCDTGSPAWSPDSTKIAVSSNCGGGEQDQVYVIDLATGTPKQLAAVRGYVDDVTYAPDGSSVAILYMENATGPKGATAMQRLPEGVITPTSGQDLQRIAVLPVDGSALRFVTPTSLHIYQYNWSADASRVVYTAAPPPGEDNWWTAKVYTQQISGGDPKVVFDPAAQTGSMQGLQVAVPAFSPDGAHIAFIYGLMSDFGPTGGDVVVVPSAGGASKNVTEGMKSTAEWVHWLDNSTVGFSDFDRGRSSFRSVGMSGGEPKVLYKTDGSFSSGGASMAVSFAKNNTVAFQQSSFTVAPEVYAGQWSSIAPVTSLNTQVKPSPFKHELVEWDNAGQPVQGFIVLPENYSPDKKWPLIVNVHGGPAAANVNSFNSIRGLGSFYAAAGYIVFEPNPRGSYGQGEKFTQANRRDFGYGDLQDILAGVDYLDKKYSIDDKRVGITGGSYGGFMSMFAPTQTHRFAASVAVAGISDWLSYYGENSIDQWMIPFFGKSVYEDPKAYERLSAITFIKQEKTPMLIIVGDRDGECPAPQSMEMWHALREQGVDTELVIYPNEGHGLSNPTHLMDYLARSLDWFQKYMPAQ